MGRGGDGHNNNNNNSNSNNNMFLRLMNAAAALRTSPASLLEGVDSCSLCLSKGLGAPVGSVLVGTKRFIDRAVRIRKVLGGGLRQSGQYWYQFTGAKVGN